MGDGCGFVGHGINEGARSSKRHIFKTTEPILKNEGVLESGRKGLSSGTYIYIYSERALKMQEDELRYVSQFVRTKKLLNKETLKMNKIS